MTDTTINLIRNSGKYFELLAALAGTFYFYKYRHTSLKYIMYLLWYITITEFFAWYMRETGTLIYRDEGGRGYSNWIYNVLRFITFNTFFYIYHQYLTTSKFKKWVKLFAIGYSVFYFLNWIFIQDFFEKSSELPKVTGSIFLIITIIFYFIELMRSEKIVIFHRMLLFWISIGLLLFYTGTIPFTLTWNGYALIPGIHKLFLILYILAIMMYLIFTFGFIWSKKEQH